MTVQHMSLASIDGWRKDPSLGRQIVAWTTGQKSWRASTCGRAALGRRENITLWWDGSLGMNRRRAVKGDLAMGDSVARRL